MKVNEKKMNKKQFRGRKTLKQWRRDRTHLIHNHAKVKGFVCTADLHSPFSDIMRFNAEYLRPISCALIWEEYAKIWTGLELQMSEFEASALTTDPAHCVKVQIFHLRQNI